MFTFNAATDRITPAGYAIEALIHAEEGLDFEGNLIPRNGHSWNADLATHHIARTKRYMAIAMGVVA